MISRKSIHTVLALWACALSQNAAAQIVPIRVVHVTANRLDHILPTNDARIDTLNRRFHSDVNLSEQIQSESSIYIRSYGPGLASTVSRHGYSPSQTSVYWNGVPLNSPALGLSDLSTLPTGFDVTLDEGAAGALYGSGYMGGGIHLQSEPSYSKKWSVRQSAQYRTAGYASYSTQGSYSTQSTAHMAAIDYGKGQMDFKYTDLYGVQRDRLGADQESLHLRYNGKKNWLHSRLDWGVWASELNRGIPRSISESYTVGARQFDQVARAYVKFNWSNGPVSLGLRTSGYAEDQRYHSTVLSDTNIASAIYDQVDLAWHVSNRFKLVYSLDHAYQYVEGSSKDSRSVNRYGTSILMSYQYDENWSGAMGGRLEHQLITTPFIPFAHVKWKKGVYDAQLSFRSHFRFPTLNDLYWNPGGNPHLKPELGNTIDFHSGYNFGIDQQNRVELSSFYSIIDQYIQWVPDGAIFQPRNVKAVRTSGMTIDYEYVSKVDFDFILGGNYTWTYARTIESQRLNDPGLNNQLIYTPEHKLAGRISVAWYDAWEVKLVGTFNGRVHTTSDNQDALAIPSFFVLDSEVSYERNFAGDGKIRGSIGIRNMTNAEYSFQRFYPMPGIQAVFSLTIQFAQHET